MCKTEVKERTASTISSTNTSDVHLNYLQTIIIITAVDGYDLRRCDQGNKLK